MTTRYYETYLSFDLCQESATGRSIAIRIFSYYPSVKLLFISSYYLQNVLTERAFAFCCAACNHRHVRFNKTIRYVRVYCLKLIKSHENLHTRVDTTEPLKS